MKLDVILDTRASARELAALGRLAERFGIDGIWVSSLPDSRDPFANLSLLAAATSRIRLGPVAVNPFDTHPFKIATALLTLNELAQGRARIVVGGGGEALEALGISPERRVRAVREAVEIIRTAASGELLDYQGELYQVRRLQLRWLQATRPAIFVGASQTQMLRMGARVADGIMMSDMPAAACAAAISTLDHALTAQQRTRPEFWTSAFTAWHVGPDAQLMRHEARRWLLLRGIFRPWLLAQFLAEQDVQLVMNSRPAFLRAFAAGSHTVEGVPERILDKLVDELTICATPADQDRILAHLETLRGAGLGSIALRLYARPADSIRFIGRQLLPALRYGEEQP